MIPDIEQPFSHIAQRRFVDHIQGASMQDPGLCITIVAAETYKAAVERVQTFLPCASRSETLGGSTSVLRSLRLTNSTTTSAVFSGWSSWRK